MARRLDRSWTVYASVENDQHNRCVDLFCRADGSYGFEEFRRDPEDGGIWQPAAYYSGLEFSSHDAAVSAARGAIMWFAEVDAPPRPKG